MKLRILLSCGHWIEESPGGISYWLDAQQFGRAIQCQQGEQKPEPSHVRNIMASTEVRLRDGTPIETGIWAEVHV